MDRNIYLTKITLEEAKQKIEEAILEKKIIFKRESEIILTKEALDRITAEPVYARRSSLHYAAVAMDGIAVHSRDTSNTTESNPVILTYQKDFLYVNTGNPLPEGFDAVIKIEEVVLVEKDKSEKDVDGGGRYEQLKIFKAVFPGLNVRQVGEDIITNQLILAA
ncbi:MAG TPA: molybdopterin biosynthesis protein, partial [Atribacterota bacterium]|nr:molybdopterin biosynthesis protein [Atribacterota bacterium]